MHRLSKEKELLEDKNRELAKLANNVIWEQAAAFEKDVGSRLNERSRGK